ncbi:unnamed protein product [Protopolystoma xenopodis]|uniref:Uncharacterized protein n=1 Tax=Protopolystoma xenopodis TaxID=117903 RepID=A0A3S5AZS0_9PLAT|nr:unnamed protein product [Protopolystoma xenopodis]
MSNQHGSSPYPHQTQSNFSSIHHQPQAGSFHSIANSRSLPVNTSLMAYPLSRSQPASSGGTRELVDSGCDGQGAINCLPVTQPRRSSVHSGRHIYYTMHPYLRHQPSLLPNGCVSSNSDLTRRHEQQHRLYSLSGESIVVRRLHSTSSSSSVTSVGLPNLDSVGAQNCLGAGGDCSSAGSIDDGTDFDDLGPMACPESCYASEPLPSSSYSDFDDGGLKCEVRLVDCRNGINEGYSHSNFDYMGKSIVLHQSSSLRRSVPPPIYLDGARAPVRISVGDPSDEPASAVTIKSSPSHDFIIRSE